MENWTFGSFILFFLFGDYFKFLDLGPMEQLNQNGNLGGQSPNPELTISSYLFILMDK